jgi:aminomethyltransferase
MTSDAGWVVPARYTDPADELAALRDRAGVVDLSHLGQIEVSGPDAAASLTAALVLPAGVPAVHRTIPARRRAPSRAGTPDLLVHRLARDEYLVGTDAAGRLAVLDALLLASHRPDLGERVLVADRTESRVLLALCGPAAAGVLLALAGTAPERGGCTLGWVAGAPVVLARPDEALLTLSGPATAATALWHAVLAAGAAAGVRPCGVEALRTVLSGAAVSFFPDGGGAAYGRPTSTDLRPTADAAVRPPGRHRDDATENRSTHDVPR